MRSIRTPAAIALALALAAPASAAAAGPRSPHLSWIKCVTKCGQGKTQVQQNGEIKLAGSRFSGGARVVFSVNSGGARKPRTVGATLTGTTRLTVRVPSNALSSRIYVRLRGGLRSNAQGPLTIVPPPAVDSPSHPTSGTALAGDGMWIWQMPRSDGGDPNAILARARAGGIETVFIKSGDTTEYWTQFSPELLNALHAGGLKVCGWQYVKGADPVGEAAVAARAVQTGADCFVIDAEAEYERNPKKYENAAAYLSALRATPGVGEQYPLALTTFPYVDFHPSFPYSAFLGPGGAQFNLPQSYWKSIGDTVDASVSHTYLYNRPYGRPILPIGQTYSDPPAQDMTRFRQLVAAEGSEGLSWWSWQETSDPEWAVLGQPTTQFVGAPPAQDFIELKQGAKGDLVFWAQRHLIAAGQAIKADGDYGPATAGAASNFQTSRGIPVTGTVNTQTWTELLKLAPAAAKRAPKSAKLAPKRQELPKTLGRP